MAQKHKKKRASQGRKSSYDPGAESEFAADGRRKRMSPLARSIMFVTLVVLAISELTRKAGVLPEEIATIISIIALILLLVALYVQFNQPGGSGSGPNRLR